MRKPCFLLLLVLLVPLLGPAVAATAATLGDERVGFSADRLLVIDGHTYSGKIWANPGEERHEQAIAAFRPIFLLHAGSPVGEAVLPQLKTVVQFVVPPEWRLLPLGGAEVKKRPIGEESINGVATTKYAITETVPEGEGEGEGGGRAEGMLWLSRDGIPMKLAGTFTGKKAGKPIRVRWELSHVQIGPQPADLFEPPPGFATLPAEALAPLLGLRLKSAKR
jgi:hypothetical protein